MKKIGFIGTGIMGKAIIRNLMKKGFEVSVYNRTPEHARDVVMDGALLCETIADCAKGRDAVITMVGYPSDVEEVYFGENGILENADQGTYLIDMTTSSPKLAVKIYEEGKKKGLKVLDAPVTGGQSGAERANLTILAAGDEDDFNACLPIFQAVGMTIGYEGQAGNGQHTKICNQIAIAGALSGACEAIAYARAAGIKPGLMLASITEGAAASFQLSNVAIKGFQNDFAPGFYVKHFIKDMKLAEEGLKDTGVKLGVLDQVLAMFEELEKEGCGEMGTQALLKYYDRFNKE